jgi:hypothetical protein
MRGSLFRCTVLASTAALWVMAPSAAAAQAPAERDVRIEFEVGDFDAARSDWPITEVLVSGDLDVGETFVVELRDGDGGVIWAGEDEYSPPQTVVEVDRFVAVGDVEEAAIGQRMPLPVEPAPEIEPAVVPVPPQEPEVAAAVTTIAPDDPEPVVVPQDPAPSPDVAADVVTRPDAPLPQQGSGLGGAGQLALSMVVAVVFVAILFRTPLPAATTQRWRR